ncbi:MAG: PAS domain S-box protein, partial [Anaerolineae bacterium]
MKDQGKTKEQLISELADLRQRVAELEVADTERKRAEERLARMNECFLNLGTDPLENINRLTALCGELLGATCALYNRLDQGMLVSWGQWNAPLDYSPVDKPEGHICYDVIKHGGDQILIVRNLPETHYAQTDPNVIPYKLQTYIGQPVKFGDAYVGSLCVVYQKDFVPSEEDKRLMEIIASAIGVEERRKQAEEALQESEAKHKTLMEEAPIGLCNVDLNGRITYVNKRFEEVSGYSREEVVGKNGFKLGMFSDETLNLLAERIRSRLKGEPARVLEVRFKCKDGRWIWVEIEGRVIKKWGVPVGFQLSSRDITERKQAEEALRESEEELQAIFDGVGDGLALIDMTGKVIKINKRITEVGGYAEEEIVGKRIALFKMFPPQSLAKVLSNFTKLIAGQQCPPFDVEVYTETGGKLDVELRGSLLRKRGKAVGMIGVMRDITDRKQAEKRVRRLLDQQVAVNRLALALGESRDIDKVYHTIYEHVWALMDAKAFMVSFYDDETQLIRAGYVVAEGTVRDAASLPPIPLQEVEYGTQSQVIHTGEPFYVPDLRKMMERSRTEHTIYENGTVVEGPPPPEREDISRSALYVPMKIKGETIGVMQVQSYRLDAYSQEDIDLLSALANVAAVAIQNARLYEETRQRALEQETVSRIAYALNTPDVRDAFPVLVEGLRNLTGCDTVNLLVMDEAGEQFIMSVLECPFPMPGVGDVMPLSATAAAEDVESGRPHLTADLSTETHFPLELAFYQAGLRSQVTLPLLVGGEVFGALNLGGSHTGIFREDQLPVLRQIADAVALALENSLLFQVEREQRELAESLEEAAAVVSSTLDPDQVLDRILEQVSRVVPNDATNIMLIEGDQAHVVRWRSYERFGAEEIVSTVVFRIPEVPGLQQMLESGEPMVIPDTATYPGWVRVPATEWLRSYAATPIIVRGEVIGFLNVDSVTPGFFTQTHAEGLRVFADHAAAAIENARLYEAEQKRRHIAETLRQASTVLSSTLELDEVLGLILQQLRQVIPYDSASVQRL